MNKRNYELTLNVTTGKIKIPSISIYNTDKGIFNIKLFLEKGEGKNIVKLTHDEMVNYKALFQAVKSKTKNYVELEGILDETENFFYYDLGSKFNDQVGVYNCQIFVTDTKGTKDNTTDDEIVTSVPFNYTVTASILTGLNAEITANPDLPVLQELINECKILMNLDSADMSVLDPFQKKEDDAINGTDKNIISNINSINSQIKDKANLTELEVERKRIDSFVRLENGSTTGDAELMDIRIGADSNEYVTAGQAVREQIKQYVKYVGVNSENLFDYINATDGYYNSLDGTLNTTSGYKTTGLIPYKVGDVIRKSKDVSWFVQWIGFFDINGNILISDIGIDDYVDRSNSSYDEFCLSEKPQNGSLDNLAYITIAVSNFGETNDFANYMIVKNIDYPSNYVPYGFNYSNNFTNKILEEIEKM